MKQLVALTLLLSAASISLYASQENNEDRTFDSLICHVISLTTLQVSDEELSYKVIRSNEDQKLRYAITFDLVTKKGKKNNFALNYLDEINHKQVLIKATGKPRLYEKNSLEASNEKTSESSDLFNEIALKTVKLVLKNPIEMFKPFTQKVNAENEEYSITISSWDPILNCQNTENLKK